MAEALETLVRTGAEAQLVLLAAWLVLGVPLAGARRRSRFSAALSSGGRTARLTVYRRTAVGQAAVATYAVVLALVAGASLRELGLRVDVVTGLAALAVVVAAFVGIGRARSRGPRTPQRAGLATVDPVLPRTAHERLVFAGVALVVGAAEEVVYRGVGLWAAQEALGLPPWAAVAVVAAAFGLAHTWQGARAVAVTGLLGGVLGVVAVLSGGVLLAAALHAAIDLRVLGLQPARLPRRTAVSGGRAPAAAPAPAGPPTRGPAPRP